MSESNNAAIMALIRAEFKKLHGAGAAEASVGESFTASLDKLQDRLVALESSQREWIADLQGRTEALARVIGILHASLPNSEPIPDDLLRQEVFRSFMENYPESADPPYDQTKLDSIAQDMRSWSAALVAQRRQEKEAELASSTLDPLDTYKARLVLALIANEDMRRRETEITKDHQADRER